MAFDVDVVIDAKAGTGEGPVWDERAGVLRWVDIPAGLLHTYDPATKEDAAVDVGQPLGAVRLREAGGFVLAVQNGFASLGADGRVAMIAEVEADNAETRMNDGACDRQGRFWAGTMGFDALNHVGEGSLYRLDPDGSVHRMLEGTTISNGIDWSPDDTTMYYIDSLTFSVEAFDFDAASGAISNRRAVVQFDDTTDPPVVPDGMTIDAEGCLWVAFWNGSAVHRYAPDGTLLATVEVPTPQVTACAFGGDDYSDLYITSALGRLDPADEPYAGALFRCRPGVNGRPENRFAG